MKKIVWLLAASVLVFTACRKEKTPPAVPTVTTAALTNITTTGATAGGTITSNGGAAITASGVVLSRSNATPTLSDTVLTAAATSGSFTVNLTDLVFGTTYYVRAYATNSAGTGYGNVVTMTTVNDDTKVKFMYMGQEVVYGIIVSPTTGRKWLDRNLGASAVATSLTDTAGYGDLFQWGRLADGHQLRTSDTTFTLSSADIPGHGLFILPPPFDPYDPSAHHHFDWRKPQNDNLWQGSNGVNNPCPAGWYVPSNSEWEAETGIIDANTAFSQLKLTLGGARTQFGFGNVNGFGMYSSSTISGSNRMYFVFSPSELYTASVNRYSGISVRCIKD